jgi:hypothetical protein
MIFFIWQVDQLISAVKEFAYVSSDVLFDCKLTARMDLFVGAKVQYLVIKNTKLLLLKVN